jgi:NAD(P)H dehydrogenase (quinone)
MILVTSASGQTGTRLIAHLVGRGQRVRGQVVRSQSMERVAALGAEPVIANLRDEAALRRIMRGVGRVYHIAPSLAYEEHGMGRLVLAAAAHAGVGHFVLHGVMAPYLEHLPFHWAKQCMQLDLFRSGMPYTVLMGTNYMQNVSWTWPTIVERGEWILPYSTEKRLTWLDLEDAAEAAANVLTESGHEYASYELCGKDSFLSRSEIAAMMSRALGKPVRAVKIGIDEYLNQARTMPFFQRFRDEEVAQVRAMFVDYDTYGFPAGNSKVLSMLLGRSAGSYAQFLERLAKGLAQPLPATTANTYGLPV